MDKYISFSRLGEDDGVIELRVVTSDGESVASVNVYDGADHLKAMVPALNNFKTHVHGGIFDLEVGAFGPEYAKGAFRARLHFYPPGRGRICITVDAESEWYEFGMLNEVANRATLRLHAEPAQLDDFIREFTALAEGRRDNAGLKCV